MITVGMNYDVLPGKEKIFEDACQRVIGAMEGNTGHQHSRLFKDVNKAGSYLIVSEWNSRDAFSGFIASDAFKKVTNWGKENILAGRPQHTVYEN